MNFTSPRLQAVLLTATLLVAAVLGHVGHQRNWLEPHDDQLYLFALTTQFAEPARFSAVSDEFGKFVRERADSAWQVTRYEARYRYRSNYSGASYLGNLVFTGLGNTSLKDESFAYRAAVSFSITSAVITTLCMLALLLALALARDIRLLAAVTVTSVIIVFEGLLRLDSGQRLISVGPGTMLNPVDLLARIAGLIIDPGNAAHLFGAASRHGVMLLLLALFLLRWQGRLALSYWLFLPITFLHQSYAGLFLAIVVGLDVLQRPRSLLRFNTVAPIAIVAALFVMRESLWQFVGLRTPLALLGGFVLAGLALLLLRFSAPGRYLRLLQTISGAQTRLRSNPVVADAILLLCGWLGFLMLTIVGNYFATADQSTLFWGHSAGRILATLRPVLFVALIYTLLIRRQDRPKAASELTAATLGVAVLLVPVLFVRWPVSTISHVIDRNTAIMKNLETRLHTPIATLKAEHQDLIFYAIAQSVITGRDTLRNLR